MTIPGVTPQQNRPQNQNVQGTQGTQQPTDSKLLQDIKGLLEQLLQGKGGPEAGGAGKPGGVDPSQMDPDQLEKMMQKLREAMQSQLPPNPTNTQRVEALENVMNQMGLDDSQKNALRQIIGQSGAAAGPSSNPASVSVQGAGTSMSMGGGRPLVTT